MLDLVGAPRLEVLDGPEPRPLVHRVEFAEHPSSAPLVAPAAGRVRAAHFEVGAGEWFGGAPPGDLAAFARYLAGRGALGALVPLRSAGGYLAKRVAAGAPLDVAVVGVRDDLLPALAGREVRVTLPLRRTGVRGATVLGEIAGGDPELAGEPVLLGAHYDGVGDDPGGHRLPGAADNAAGVAVVLQVASVLGALAVRPRRPLLLAAFDAEEVGALGSRAFAQELRERGLRPLVVNLDGAARFREAVWVEASPNAQPLLEALDRAGEEVEVPLVLGPVASDNRRYAGAGFPSVGVALGGSGGHTPDDLPERVDPGAMAVAARLLVATVWLLAS